MEISFKAELDKMIGIAKRKNNRLMDEEICMNLLKFDATQEQINNAIEYIKSQGINVEKSEDLFKDDDIHSLEKLISQASMDDPVKMYLKDIGRLPMLSNDEEIEVAKAVASGDKIAKEKLVNAFTSELIRFYYGEDLLGNEIGAAAKNVIGIAAGMLDVIDLTKNLLLLSGFLSLFFILVNSAEKFFCVDNARPCLL